MAGWALQPSTSTVWANGAKLRGLCPSDLQPRAVPISVAIRRYCQKSRVSATIVNRLHAPGLHKARSQSQQFLSVICTPVLLHGLGTGRRTSEDDQAPHRSAITFGHQTLLDHKVQSRREAAAVGLQNKRRSCPLTLLHITTCSH